MSAAFVNIYTGFFFLSSFEFFKVKAQMKSSWLKRESHSHGSSELLWHLSPCLNETSLRVVTLRAGARRRQWCMYQTWVIIRLYISHGGGNRHLVVDRYKHSCLGVNCNYCCWGTETFCSIKYHCLCVTSSLMASAPARGSNGRQHLLVPRGQFP